MALSMQTRRLALGMARALTSSAVRPMSACASSGFKGQQQEQAKQGAQSSFRLVAAVGAGLAGLGLYGYEKTHAEDPYKDDPVRHPAMRPNSVKPYCAEAIPAVLGVSRSTLFATYYSG